MSSETPGVKEGLLISCSASKDDHHAVCSSCGTQGSRMVHSHRRDVPVAFQFGPEKRGLFYVQSPNVIDSFVSCIATVNDQVRFREGNSMAISSSGGCSHNRNDNPLRMVLTGSEIEEIKIVWGELASYGELG